MFAVVGVRRQSDFGCSGAEHSNASQFNKEAVKIFIFLAPLLLAKSIVRDVKIVFGKIISL
jgi:hypothetical protein